MYCSSCRQIRFAAHKFVVSSSRRWFCSGAAGTISFDIPNLHYQPGFDTKLELSSRKHSNLRFNDKIRIRCAGGNGGQGCVSFEAHARKRGKPTGGSGGVGGDVIIQCIDSIGGFNFSRRSFQASNGGNGYENKKHGSRGRDCTITVPRGTVVTQIGVYRTYDRTKADHILEREVRALTELLDPGDEIYVCKGGNGGKGNLRLKNESNNHPRWSEMGEHGECVLLELELKSIADIGFVGYPNAGKSTLLSSLSRTKPAISSLPFTTLNPHIGHVQVDKDTAMSMADIPGIIEGAAENKGLGLEFLKHIERCKVLVYILDIIGCDGRCPVEDFKKLRYELYCYDERLISEKPSIVFCNKMDILIDYDRLYEGQLVGYKDRNELKRTVHRRIKALKELVGSEVPVVKGSGVQRNVDDLLILCKSMRNEYDKVMDTKEAIQYESWKSGEIDRVNMLDDITNRNRLDESSASDSDMEMPSWGNVVWIDEEEKDERGNIDNITDTEYVDCPTKIDHLSAAKLYYEQFDTNRIHRYEDHFQETTKHKEPPPEIEYETFKFEDSDGRQIDRQSAERDDESDVEGLAKMFNVDYRKEQQVEKSKAFEKLKRLR